MKKKGILVVVSGFAGTGKGTLMKRLLSDYDNYALSVSMTTRKPRPGEVNGREYFFVSNEEFEKTIKEDGLVEYAGYCDHYYGTPRAYVEEQLNAGKDVILEIEIQGALKIKEKFPDSFLVFVLPPSAAELKARLVGRATETPEVIEQRLNRAVEESKGIEKYDCIALNDDIDECTKRLHAAIMSAHWTTDRNIDFIEQIRTELEALPKGE